MFDRGLSDAYSMRRPGRGRSHTRERWPLCRCINIIHRTLLPRIVGRFLPTFFQAWVGVGLVIGCERRRGLKFSNHILNLMRRAQRRTEDSSAYIPQIRISRWGQTSMRATRREVDRGFQFEWGTCTGTTVHHYRIPTLQDAEPYRPFGS